eukprot:77249_1
MSNLYLAPIWIYLAFITGLGGSIIILVIGSHTIYHEQRTKIGMKHSRFISILFFTISWITCIGFGFFRSNLILPMGSSIPCLFGYYLGISGVFLCKIFLFVIFLYRIHLAFGETSYGYSVPFLITVSFSYFFVISLLYGLYVLNSWSAVGFRTLSQDSTLGVCTIAGRMANAQHKLMTFIRLSIGLGDVVYSLFVCGLFVYKLVQIIKATRSETETHNARKSNMVLLVRKQTTLVFIACITSILTIGSSAVVSGPNYCVAIDMTTNAICVWLMYSFTKQIWNGCIKYVCCCFYCCVYRQELILNQMLNVMNVKAKSVPSTTKTNVGAVTAV